MNIQLKQRLVGAVVLVALAVIFIPMLLPGKGELSSGISGSNIPPEPDYRFSLTAPAPEAPPMAAAPSLPIDDKSLDQAIDETLYSTSDESPAKSMSSDTEKTENAPTKQATSTTPETAAKQAIVTDPTPPTTMKEKSAKESGWVVQVGSFSSTANAKALRDKLRKQGHASFMEAVKGKSGTVYRVRVGPEVSRDSAERLRKQLAETNGLKGLVQAYP